MKTIKILTALAGWLIFGGVLSSLTAAPILTYGTGNLASETALAYDKNFTMDLRQEGVINIAAQAIYSSATLTAKTFVGGTVSTGSLTIASNTGLSTAAAHNTITVLSTSSLSGASIVFPGYPIRQGWEWRVGATVAATAINIKNAINKKIPYVTASTTSANVVTLTVVSNGTAFNAITATSSVSSITVLANFVGGLDNAIVKINGTDLRCNTDWTTGASSAATATNIITAINANAKIKPWVVATSGGTGIITLTSKIVGTKANFLYSATPVANIVAKHAAMTGGTNADYTLGSGLIHSVAHGFTLALPVVYSTGDAAIGGFTHGVTYYAAPYDVDNFYLSSSKVNAIAGTYIVATSSALPTTTRTYTLIPAAIAGTPTLKWQGSVDGTAWVDVTAPSLTISAYTNPYDSYLWDFGAIPARYVRAVVVAPTSGGLGLKIAVRGY